MPSRRKVCLMRAAAVGVSRRPRGCELVAACPSLLRLLHPLRLSASSRTHARTHARTQVQPRGGDPPRSRPRPGHDTACQHHHKDPQLPRVPGPKNAAQGSFTPCRIEAWLTQKNVTHHSRQPPLVPVHTSLIRAAQQSRRGHAHAPGQHACIAPCPMGSRSAAPTAALPAGRHALLRCTFPCPTRSPAGAPTAALPGGHSALHRCMSRCPKGTRAGAPIAALPGGHRALHWRTSLRAVGSRAAAPSAALPAGRSLLLWWL